MQMDADDDFVRVRVELTADGAYCARDTSESFLAHAEDPMDLARDIEEIIRMAFGENARARLIVEGPGINWDSVVGRAASHEA
jgi:hypothetical protein